MAVYARLRPPRPGSGDPPCEVLPAADDRSGSRKKSVPTDLEFTVQRKASAGHVNNLPQRFCFHFDGVRVCAAPLASHAVQHTSPRAVRCLPARCSTNSLARTPYLKWRRATSSAAR